MRLHTASAYRGPTGFAPLSMPVGQARIVRAVRAGKWHRVRSLHRLLARSLAAKLFAVKRVSSNRGKRTAGVDGLVPETPAQKWRQAQQLDARNCAPKPLKRIYIPKKNGKCRPLGIPVQADRAEQALELLALDPVSATLADPCSYPMFVILSSRTARNPG